MASEVRVELVFALADKQQLLELSLPAGATVAEAIEAADLASCFPDQDFAGLKAGIWGRVVPRERVLSDGDRVEIYRPLELDPREARRQLASIGRTMADGATD